TPHFRSGAIADYDRAIALDPTLAELYFNRATTAQPCEQNTASTDYDKTAGLPLNNAAFYRHRAQVRAHQGKWKAAISDYSTAIAITPTAYAHYHRGLAYLKAGDSDKALVDFDCALALSPDYWVVYCARTQLRFQQHNAKGAPEGALEDAQQAISLSTKQAATQKSYPLKQAYAIACLSNFCLGNQVSALESFQQLITHIQTQHQTNYSSSSHTSNEATSMGSTSRSD
ncbi:MAG: tetratricopeptide repeat protein, partial [Cyanobacteria bacterium J06643_4]